MKNNQKETFLKADIEKLKNALRKAWAWPMGKKMTWYTIRNLAKNERDVWLTEQTWRKDFEALVRDN